MVKNPCPSLSKFHALCPGAMPIKSASVLLVVDVEGNVLIISSSASAIPKAAPSFSEYLWE